MPLGQIAGGIFALTGGADPQLPRRSPSVEARSFGNALRWQLPYNQFYAPQLAGLADEERNRQLFGDEGGLSTEQTYGLKWVSGTERQFDWRTGQWIPGRPGHWETVQRGMDVFRPKTEGLFAQVERAQPELEKIRRAGDPTGLSLLDQLTSDASSLVGRSADPYEDRMLTESLRGAQTSRGLAHSPSAAIREVLALDRARDERRMGRGRYGAGILATRRGYLGDPTTDALRVLGGVDLTSAREFTNPFNAYNSDLQNTNFGAESYEEIARRNNRMQGITSTGQGVSSLAMLGMGGMGGMGGGARFPSYGPAGY